MPEAEAAYRQAAALADAAGTYPPGVLLIKAQLGALLLSSGRAEEASALLSSLLPLAAELGLGDEELVSGRGRGEGAERFCVLGRLAATGSYS